MEVDATHQYEPDDPTATLILQLQSEDIEELLNASKGKGRDGELSDANLAVATYQQELQMSSAILADRCMSRSLTRAVISDATPTIPNETLANETRASAFSLIGMNVPSTAPVQAAVASDLDDDSLARRLVRRLARLFGSNGSGDTIHSDASAAAESSTWAKSRLRSATTASHHCTACNIAKPLSDVCQTPCGHFYCQECIQTLFDLSAADETLFPPRCCCMAIPLSSVKTYLTPASVQTFEQKTIKFQTSDRTYCSQQSCSSFIPPVDITSEQATCKECGTQTCIICKNNAHDGDCPQDVVTQQVLEMARKMGWQRCYVCRRVVELDVGCNHMVCPCSAQFCYVCGERWKTCACDQWNEDRLFARANQVVARRPAQAGVARERQVDQAAAHLRERHNCVHEDWRFTLGAHQCEECHSHLPHYIFECQQCRILACHRCKLNRL